MLEVLAFFIDICEKNQLRYSLAYGSILGAVRHHGIIPWDDDIDTYMPRPDYEKFIQIFKQLKSSEYEILLPGETDYYAEPFAKIGNKNTSLLFDKIHPVDYGVFIDIFPLDGAPKTTKERHANFNSFNNWLRIYRVFQTRHTLKSYWYMLTHGAHKHAMMYLLLKPFWKKAKYYCTKKMLKIAHSTPYDNSDYVIQYRDDSYGIEKAHFPRIWIEQTQKVPFENMMVRIPLDADAYLKHYYGDYMVLPPEDKRDDRHTIDYMNLDRREPMKEILTKI